MNKQKKITNPDKMYQWIVNNHKKMGRRKTEIALDRWGISAGYTMLDGNDFLYILENVRDK
jgi:hypothetical protein